MIGSPRATGGVVGPHYLLNIDCRTQTGHAWEGLGWVGVGELDVWSGGRRGGEPGEGWVGFLGQGVGVKAHTHTHTHNPHPWCSLLSCGRFWPLVSHPELRVVGERGWSTRSCGRSGWGRERLVCKNLWEREVGHKDLWERERLIST